MKILLACAALLTATTAFARPVLVHESQYFTQPPNLALDTFGTSIAIDGEWAIVMATTPMPQPTGYPFDEVALLYRRVDSEWKFQRVLARDPFPSGIHQPGAVAMGNGLAALSFSPLYVFARSGTTWRKVSHPFDAPFGSADGVSGGNILEWSGTSLVTGVAECHSGSAADWGALVAKRASAGAWSTPQRLSSGVFDCREVPVSTGFSGNTVAIASWTTDTQLASNQLRVFKNDGTGWHSAFTLPNSDGQVDVRGNEIFVGTRTHRGTLVYRNDSSATVVDTLRPVNTLYNDAGYGYEITHSDDLVLQGNFEAERGAGINAFRKNSAGRYAHVAVLEPKAPGIISGALAVSGRRVLAEGYRSDTDQRAVFAFDLPASFSPRATRQYTFEAGNANGWTAVAGQFTVATRNGNRVFRQSSLVGDARAVLGDSNWTDQGVEADIRPLEFAGSDRWLGLAVRYVDASNHYYVTLRNSGTIELRRKVNGVVTGLNQIPFTFQAGTNYRIHLQALGPQLWVYVDGRRVLSAFDTELPRGRVALLGYRTAGEFDNVLVEDLGQFTMVDTIHRGCEIDEAWTVTGSSSWSCGGGTLAQTSLAGDARAVIGVPTDDQVISVFARATAFAPSTGSQERWFGVAARYRDTRNYYYLSVRNSNRVSLRKQVNGAVTVLASAPLPVAAGTWYELRLETIGNSLRGYVDGELVVQANDTSLASGIAGPVMFRTAAEYNAYLAYQP